MKKIILFFLTLFIYNVGDAQTLNTNDSNKIVATIYIIEGGSHTKYPYGVRSIETVGDTNKARRICLNTVSNNFQRWNAQIKESDYFNFLASKYCPVSADPQGHRNWLHNIQSILGTNFCAKVNALHAK